MTAATHESEMLAVFLLQQSEDSNWQAKVGRHILVHTVQQGSSTPSLPSCTSLLMATLAFSMVQTATDSPLQASHDDEEEEKAEEEQEDQAANKAGHLSVSFKCLL